MVQMPLLLLSVSLLLQVLVAAPAAQRMERIRNNPLELRAFLEKMPKGADLHTHLFGAIYAESFIQAAAADGLCVDKNTLTVLPARAACAEGQATAANAFRDQGLYTALVDAFSMRSFVPSAGVSNHDHFFAAFDRFQNIDIQRHLGDWLDEMTERAARQNEQYLEIMHTPDFALAARLGYQVGWSGNPAAARDALLRAGVRANVETDRHELDAAETDRARVGHCSDRGQHAGCAVEVRYLFQVLRGFPPEQVFAQLLLGFELASVDPRVVGINLVMPEDWTVPMAQYHRQMQMLDYLHALYPKVHIALHAGELAPGLVPPDGLRFHIREAVELGHAERIGHGVSVIYEPEPRRLLAEMAARQVAVEVNLTSNDLILGIRGKSHPLPTYRAARVPVVLATDDEGVSRIDLTHEYERAVEEFGLRYSDLKEMARAAIEHSFLPAAEKARQNRELERRFRVFEAAPQ